MLPQRGSLVLTRTCAYCGRARRVHWRAIAGRPSGHFRRRFVTERVNAPKSLRTGDLRAIRSHRPRMSPSASDDAPAVRRRAAGLRRSVEGASGGIAVKRIEHLGARPLPISGLCVVHSGRLLSMQIEGRGTRLDEGDCIGRGVSVRGAALQRRRRRTKPPTMRYDAVFPGIFGPARLGVQCALRAVRGGCARAAHRAVTS
jgi:hypothetical protein